MDRPIRVMIVAALTAAACWTANAPAAPPAVGGASKYTTQQLIQRLGDESFKTREEAGKELVRRGAEIRAELVEALKYPDLEVRLRVRQILVQVAEEDLQRRIAAFIADTEGKQEHDLPGWKRFAKLAGSGRRERELFAEMIRSEQDILRLVEARSRELSPLLAVRIQNLQQMRDPRGRPLVSRGSLATLLFLGADRGLQIDINSVHRMYSYLSNSYTMNAITKGPNSDVMMQLVRGWFERGVDSGLAQQFVMLAMRYNLGEWNRELARDLVQKKNVQTQGLAYSILLLGKYGKPQDAALLQRHMMNGNVCYRWSRARGKERILISVEVRDVALAVTIRLAGQNPKNFGFDMISANSSTLYSINTLGFSDEKLRSAAFEKWRQWRENQSK